MKIYGRDDDANFPFQFYREFCVVAVEVECNRGVEDTVRRRGLERRWKTEDDAFDLMCVAVYVSLPIE